MLFRNGEDNGDKVATPNPAQPDPKRFYSLFRCRGNRTSASSAEPPVAPTPGNMGKICCYFAHNFIRKGLRFFRDLARKKWPSWGSENPRNPPIPPFGKGGRRGDFVKGGRGGIYRECAGKFLLTNMLVLVWR